MKPAYARFLASFNHPVETAVASRPAEAVEKSTGAASLKLPASLYEQFKTPEQVQRESAEIC